MMRCVCMLAACLLCRMEVFYAQVGLVGSYDMDIVVMLLSIVTNAILV